MGLWRVLLAVFFTRDCPLPSLPYVELRFVIDALPMLDGRQTQYHLETAGF